MNGGLAAWWARLGRGQRIGVVVVGAIVAVNVAFSAMGSIVGGADQGGPASSSTSTAPTGTEAYADLLAASGYDVVRLDDPLDDAPLPADATLVIADPEQLAADELGAVGEWVFSGGRLVLAGADAAAVLPALTGVPVGWEQGDAQDRLSVWVPVADAGGASEVAGDAGGRWTDIGPLLAIAGGDDGPAIVATPLGEGTVLALADADPLQNAHLASADNAALALGLAGAPGRTVAFAESVHGAGGDWRAAVPSSWRWATAGFVVALVLGLWSAGTRFGPPEPTRRALRPPRVDHVRAVAAGIQRAEGPPRDLRRALADGEVAARAERRRLGIADPAVADPAVADPADGGAPDPGGAAPMPVAAAAGSATATVTDQPDRGGATP